MTTAQVDALRTPADTPLPYLHDHHRRELVEQSAIDLAVVAERGYRTIGRPTANDERPRRELAALGFPRWAIDEDRYYPGLLIPMYRATGERITAQWKPHVAVPNRDGKKMKYAAVKGQHNRIDVHPRNRDRIVDPTVPLWITEGVKKSDALTSRGCCVVALTGVFAWRSQLGSLGDWEDIALKGRTVTICFDADARTNPNVLRAMVRLGRWLKSKGAARVLYLIVPSAANGTPTKGADDYLAAGGTLNGLQDAATTQEPATDNADDTFSDARLAETVADEVLADRFCWTAAMGWFEWDGRRWRECHEAAVIEVVRRYALARFGEVLAAIRDGGGSPASGGAAEGWRSMLAAGRIRSVLGLARGIVLVDAAEFDQQPDLLNTPNGVIDLPTGRLLGHDPALLMTKITRACYDPTATHPDWDKALEALPKHVHDWFQIRLGQATTGHMTPDDVLVVSQGGGENGKTTMFGAVAHAIGGYYTLVSDRVILANPDAHPTELMELRGARLAVVEETPEARRLSVARLKKTVGTPQIEARRIRQDSVTFDATHSLFLSTNYRPVIEETDHGTWRRLLLLRFPFRFLKPGVPLTGPQDRAGDGHLRDRVKWDDRQRAVLRWLVDGARQWYAADRLCPAPPESVASDTRAWRTESDLVLAYVDDQLVMDPQAHVMATELLQDFNAWLSERGHRAWSDKTLVARFGEHDDLARYHLQKGRTRVKPGLSRPPNTGLGWVGAPTRTPIGPYTAWFGVRFRGADDGGGLDAP